MGNEGGLLRFDNEYNVLKIKINMEVIKKTNDTTPLKDKGKYITCLNCKGMKNRGISLKQSANYMIQLFYKTEQKYSCTRTKIGKLLSIIAFVYARKGERIFNEIIYKYDDCGTAINELKAEIDRDVYIQSKYNDDKRSINDILEKEIVIPEKYLEIDDLPDDVIREIEKVFCEFGAYSAYELGQLINPIVNYKDICGLCNEIDLTRFAELKYSDFKIQQEYDKLVKFLFT